MPLVAEDSDLSDTNENRKSGSENVGALESSSTAAKD